MGSICLRTYLEPDLARKVSKLAERQGRSESAFIASAVRAMLATGDDGPARAANDSIKRQLGRIEAELLRVSGEQALQRELILTFVQVWLEHNPPLDDAIAESLAASADARLDRFLDLAAMTYSRGGAVHLRGLEGEDDEPALTGADAEAPLS
ncbi:MAG: ribbon-helix-helix protein, CopG family [Hyphomonas sp.]|nr:ribbon-helix-helix protein, CopG family [Hyphomonas sp.]